VQLTLRLNVQVDPTTERLVQGLAQLSDPAVMAKLVEDVMRRTILEGVRKRFAKEQSSMALVSVANHHGAKALEKVQTRNQFRRFSQRIAKAQLANDVDALQSLHRDQAALVRRLTRNSTTLAGRKGAFMSALRTAASERASQMRTVRDLMTRGPFDTQADGNTLTVSVGAVPVLNRIKSASATKILTGKDSGSSYRTLWLQMEYGMGLYAKPSPSLHKSPFKTESGSWWYGARRGQGVHFLGQRPGNLLRTQLGLTYGEDSQAFTRLFGEHVNRILFGV
jgi:hypothetical protein